MIGTGIFLKTAAMTQAVGSAFWVTMAWLVAGVLSVLGAMTYAELGARFPHAGGGYVYVREAYGRLPAFLTGWISCWVIFPGSIAAYGVAAGTFIDGIFPVEAIGGPNVVSVVLIGFFGALNCLAVAFGGSVQSVLTGIKIVLIVGLAFAIFFLAPSAPDFVAGLAPFSTATPTLGAFCAATLAALWAYDGWEGISRVAGEVNEPKRNIPLALVLGTFIVFTLYCSLNLAYFWALPTNEVVTANSTLYPNAPAVAAKAAGSFLGTSGVQVLSVIFLISTIGALNGTTMTSARVPFAMARDGLFFRFLSKVSPRTRVPVRAVAAQVAVSIALALSGTFDQLTNYVVFSAWIFYGITGAAVFIVRRRDDMPTDTYRVPGYPWVPGIFVLMAATLVVTTLIESPKESMIGLGMFLTGIPFYFALFRTKQ